MADGFMSLLEETDEEKNLLSQKNIEAEKAEKEKTERETLAKAEQVQLKEEEDRAKTLEAQQLAKAEEEAKAKEKTTPTTEEVEEEDNAGKFFEAVNKLKGGEAIKVEYGEVHPLSPEGIILRDKALEKKAIETFDDTLREKFPKAYQAFLIEQSGGDPASVFSQDFVDYKSIAFDKENEQMCEDIYVDRLEKKGVDKEEIEDSVRIAKEKGVLPARAERALKESIKEQEEWEQEQSRLAKEEEKKIEKIVTEFSSDLTTIISKGKLNNFMVSDSDRKEFQKHFENKVVYDKGKMYLVEEVSKNSMEQILQAEYLKYKKGDLSKIVQQEAESRQVERAKVRLNGGETAKPKEKTKEVEKINLRSLMFNDK